MRWLASLLICVLFVLTGRDARAAGSFAQQAELSGSSGSDYGYSVAVSGNTLVVGAYTDNSERGAVYVYVQSGTNWPLQQILKAPDGAAFDHFGWSVAIEGDTVWVGAPLQNNATGGAYVFSRSGTTWSAPAKLLASDGRNGIDFGESVAISGGRAVVGAPGANNFAGEAYVFTGSGTSWSQQAILQAADRAADSNFGDSVGVSGTTVLVGANGTAYNGNVGGGAAYVFAFVGSQWQQQQEWRPPGGAADSSFGTSVAIGGTTAVVGASGYAHGTGAAFVFTVGGTTPAATLTASDGVAGDAFGSAVAISASTVVVGAPQRLNLSGAAYTFSSNANSWSELQELLPLDGIVGDGFGNAVGMSGSALAVAAFTKGNGVAYVYAPQARPVPAFGGAMPLLAFLLLVAGWLNSTRKGARAARRAHQKGIV